MLPTASGSFGKRFEIPWIGTREPDKLELVEGLEGLLSASKGPDKAKGVLREQGSYWTLALPPNALGCNRRRFAVPRIGSRVPDKLVPAIKAL